MIWLPAFVPPSPCNCPRQKTRATTGLRSSHREAAGRKKMRPDMMIVEMTDTEQHTYLPHDIDTGSRLPNLQRKPLAALGYNLIAAMTPYVC